MNIKETIVTLYVNGEVLIDDFIDDPTIEGYLEKDIYTEDMSSIKKTIVGERFIDNRRIVKDMYIELTSYTDEQHGLVTEVIDVNSDNTFTLTLTLTTEDKIISGECFVGGFDYTFTGKREYTLEVFDNEKLITNNKEES